MATRPSASEALHLFNFKTNACFKITLLSILRPSSSAPVLQLRENGKHDLNFDLICGQILMVLQKTWRVANASSDEAILTENINYACSQVDCRFMQRGCPCFSPDNLMNHASTAMKLYYQSRGRNRWNWYFMNSGFIVSTDPSEPGHLEVASPKSWGSLDVITNHKECWQGLVMGTSLSASSSSMSGQETETENSLNIGCFSICSLINFETSSSYLIMKRKGKFILIKIQMTLGLLKDFKQV
ncbi:hypothetical protein HHK36_030169 [Tetracentron sinense]|uniref:X8 domain-containing protein n=1 Tax=Tetracentron sinense TaxID=13715 RepID=A0A835D0E6_TETSI|nr:hypothetical protein HHK36_030169 [Tetracentron sinense]